MSAQLDTVTLEVIRNALPAVANEMAADNAISGICRACDGGRASPRD